MHNKAKEDQNEHFLLQAVQCSAGLFQLPTQHCNPLLAKNETIWKFFGHIFDFIFFEAHIFLETISFDFLENVH